MKKILLTGASGYIGSQLLNVLDSMGYDVSLLFRSEKSHDESRSYIYNYEDVDGLINYVNEIKPDGIIHIASFVLVEHKPQEILSLVNSNIILGTHLLEAAKIAGVKWFLNTGTFWQNYEDADYSPVNLYAATKQAFQDLAAYYTATSDLVFATLKLNDTFGLGDKRRKIFTLWCENMQTGEVLGMSGGEQIIDISYIEDVTAAYIKLIEHMSGKDAHKFKNTEFVVSNSERITLKELASKFEEAVSTKLNIEWGARPYREREVMIPWYKGALVPGWKQKYTILDAIKKVYGGENNEQGR